MTDETEDDTVECETCKGSGVVPDPDNEGETIECPDCDGFGYKEVG